MALVLLRNCSSTSEADLLRGLLATYNVLAFRFDFDESCGSGFPAMTRLMVAEEDLEEAHSILAEADR